MWIPKFLKPKPKEVIPALCEWGSECNPSYGGGGTTPCKYPEHHLKKEQATNLSRRTFLMMTPAVLTIPKLIEEVSLPVPEKILYPGAYPASTFQPIAASGMTIRYVMPDGIDWTTLAMHKDGKVTSLFDCESNPDEVKRAIEHAFLRELNKDKL